MKKEVVTKAYQLSDSGKGNRETNNFSQRAYWNTLQSILDKAQDGFILFSSRLKIIMCNQAAKKMAKEITGKLPGKNFDVFSFLQPQNGKNIRLFLSEALKGNVIEYDLTHCNKDKEKKWFHIHIYPVKNESDSTNGICVSMRNITIRKKNEETLRYNATLLDNISDAVISTDLDFNIVSINKAAERIYGLSASEVIGKKHRDVFKFEFKDGDAKHTYSIIGDTGKWNGEVSVTRRDGKKIILCANVSTVYDHEGKKTGYVGVDRDLTEQKQSEEKTRNHEIYLRTIINSTPAALFLINSDYDIVIFNNKSRLMMKKFTGVDIECGINLIEILPDFRKEDTKSKLEEVKAGYLIDYEVLYPGGIWVWVSFVPVKNVDGVITEVCVSLRDITHRKNMENTLRKNEQQYHSLVDSLAEGVVFQTFDKRSVTFNSSAIQILGAKPEEIQKYGFPLPGWSLIDENKENFDIKALIRNKTYEGESIKNLIIGIQKINEVQWLLLNIEPVKNEDDIIHACVISFSDITIALKNREELNILSNVVKETSNLVVITDAKEKIQWVNDAFTKVSGYSKEEAFDKIPGVLLAGPEKDADVTARMKECIRKGQPVEGEILNYSKTGNKYWVHFNIHPVRDKNGKLAKFFSIQSDITEHKKLEEKIILQKILEQKQITHATVKAQEAERSELGKELHDNITQLLATVRLKLGMYIAGNKENDNLVKESNDHISETIAEIRNLSHRLVGPRFVETNLQEELAKLVSNFKNGVSIDLDITQMNEDVMPSEVKLALFRIVQEQVTNILKHAKAKHAGIILKNNMSESKLSVVDDGIGFDSKQKKNGIGITNIYNRVQLLNGMVRLNSSPGHGCKLEVSIPLNEPK